MCCRIGQLSHAGQISRRKGQPWVCSREHAMSWVCSVVHAEAQLLLFKATLINCEQDRVRAGLGMYPSKHAANTIPTNTTNMGRLGYFPTRAMSIHQEYNKTSAGWDMFVPVPIHSERAEASAAWGMFSSHQCSAHTS